MILKDTHFKQGYKSNSNSRGPHGYQVLKPLTPTHEMGIERA